MRPARSPGWPFSDIWIAPLPALARRSRNRSMRTTVIKNASRVLSALRRVEEAAARRSYTSTRLV